MSDTASRNPTAASQMLADALMRTLAGATALFRVTGSNVDSSQSEVGLVATTFAQVAVSPVVMRRLLAAQYEGGQTRWEMLVSATSIAAQVNALSLASAQALFAMTLAINISGQDYLIESIAANEAMGQVYLYRVVVREAMTEAL